MRFDVSFINEIKMRLPISQVIAQKVTFDRRKTNAARGDYWACCPFHNEKTPSFRCQDSKGSYHCFGCGESGDIFSFMMKMEGLSFTQAIEKLAQLAGLELPKFTQQDDKQKEKQKSYEKLYSLMQDAAEFYQKQLMRSENVAIQNYIAQRGISQQSCQQFLLGYAPSDSNLLEEYLWQRKYSREDLIKTGLLVEADRAGEFFSRFRDRIMFPIKDRKGQIIAFGGRAIKPDTKAKYINSAETILFHKSKILYNFRDAVTFCQNNRRDERLGNLLVVEGYLDVIMMAQFGYKNAVAPLGTALTEEQLQLIWRNSSMPILCFDGDPAGLKASYRVIDRALPLLRSNVNLRFALLPSGYDPDDLLRKSGLTAFDDCLSQAKSLIDMLWQREVEDKDYSTPESCASIEKNIIEAVNLIQDNLLKNHYRAMLKQRLSQFFFQIRRNSNNIKPKEDRAEDNVLLQLNQKLVDSLYFKEVTILGILLNHDQICQQNIDRIEYLNLSTQILQDILAIIVENNRKNCGHRSIEEIKARGYQKELVDIEDSYNLVQTSLSYSKGGLDIEEYFLQSLFLYNKLDVLKQEFRDESRRAKMGDENYYNMLNNFRKNLIKIENEFKARDK